MGEKMVHKLRTVSSAKDLSTMPFLPIVRVHVYVWLRMCVFM